MKSYSKMSKSELEALRSELVQAYEDAKEKGLNLDMSRGKPAPQQLDLTMPMMDVLDKESILKTEAGVDCRNYGVLDGIDEAKVLMGDMMGVPAEQVIVCGNASLSIMFDTVSRSMTHGVCGSTPWCKLNKVKFLCPVPGYDRHFSITEHFGIEMINIPMTSAGPDMDLVEEYVNSDDAVKGIWCVPQYSNPQGLTYSDETVKRFAALKPAAEDFRIFWDNAYIVHHLYDDHDELLEIFEECKKNGNEDMVYELASTSKISFAGAGIAGVAASKKNLDYMRKSMEIQTIGYDKINQLRHVKFFINNEGINAHMKKQAGIMRPKFEMVLSVLEDELKGLGIADWTKPRGGYFISFEAMEGCAKKIIAKCKEAHVVLTGAGAAYPYGIDPKDTNIRIAPSFPSQQEMKEAAKLFVLCVKLVSVEKLLEA